MAPPTAWWLRCGVFLFTIMLSFKYDVRMKNPHAVALGKLGGKARAQSTTPQQRKEWAGLGGKARAEKLSAADRKRIAKLAVTARERKRKGKS